MGSESIYLQVETVDLSGTAAVCREFRGPYERSPEYVAQVQAYLAEKGIAAQALQVLGIYFDRPEEAPAETLHSYQGVLVNDPEIEVDEPYFVHRLEGAHLRVTVRADQPDQFAAAYGALFGYASSQGINIASEVGVQIARMAGDLILSDIHLRIGPPPSAEPV